jgi:hypothetical protein
VRAGVKTPHGREWLSALKTMAVSMGLVVVFLVALQGLLEYAADTLPSNFAKPISWRFLPALQWFISALKPLWGIGALSVVLMAVFTVTAAWGFIRGLIDSARSARKKEGAR